MKQYKDESNHELEQRNPRQCQGSGYQIVLFSEIHLGNFNNKKLFPKFIYEISTKKVNFSPKFILEISKKKSIVFPTLTGPFSAVRRSWALRFFVESCLVIIRSFLGVFRYPGWTGVGVSYPSGLGCRLAAIFKIIKFWKMPRKFENLMTHL